MKDFEQGNDLINSCYVITSLVEIRIGWWGKNLKAGLVLQRCHWKSSKFYLEYVNKVNIEEKR